jgi:hypothetical protein
VCVNVSGILIFIGLFITFSHANAVVKREIAKQSRRSLPSLLLIVCNLLACIMFIYYLFQDQKLYLRYLLYIYLFVSLNSPCIFIILDTHQQNAQITNKVQSAPYHSQTLHIFRLSMSHHQGFSNSAFQMLDRSANDTHKICTLYNHKNICFVT